MKLRKALKEALFFTLVSVLFMSAGAVWTLLMIIALEFALIAGLGVLLGTIFAISVICSLLKEEKNVRS